MSTAVLSAEEAAALVPPEMTARDLWHWRAQETPDRPWLIFEGTTWTFGEFDVEVRRLAAGLRRFGVKQGDRVLLGLKNRPETIQVQLALAELGAVSVPLVPGLTTAELAYPVEHSQGRLLIADDPIALQVLEQRDQFASIEQIVVLGDVEVPAGVALDRFDDLLTAEPLEHAPLPGYDPQTMGYIVYTSGSTGRPKGVMLKAGSLYAAGLGYSDCYRITGEDNYLLATTLAHSLGAIGALGITILTGGRLTLVERFRPTKFWDEVNRNGATVSVLFATHLNLLLEVDDGKQAAGETSLRFVVTHIFHPRFRERFGVEQGTIWGMSETCVCAGSDPGYRGELGPGYFGRPFAGAELGIFDADFNRLPPGVRGELAIRHPQVMLGYLGDPEATAATLVDGWVRSGDMAYMDHSGRGYFVGRYKAMIKRSGENVSAEEVEAALVAHPAVSECVVVGVPDPLRSEEVAAVVVPRAGATVDPAELRESCAANLVRWKLPRYIHVSAEPLPRMGNGKVDRVTIAAGFDIDGAWDAEVSTT